MIWGYHYFWKPPYGRTYVHPHFASRNIKFLLLEKASEVEVAQELHMIHSGNLTYLAGK